MAIYDINGNEIASGGGGSSVGTEELLSIYDREQTTGYYLQNAGTWLSNPTSKFTFIPVNGGEFFRASASSGRIAILAEKPVPTTQVTFATGYTAVSGGNTFRNGTTLPDDARYIFVQTKYGTTEYVYDLLEVDGINYAVSVREELYDLVTDTGVNWIQFGDSITSGYYSYFNEDGTAGSHSYGQNIVYPYLVSQMNHWKYTNKGVGGMGWRVTSTGSTQYLPYNRIKEITDWSDINLVTFAYGINDYKGATASMYGSLTDAYTYDESMTPNTVVECMRYCFDYIMSKKPDIKIIVITPFNIRNYDYGMGTYDTCYARGHSRNGYTLDQFADLMISVCNEYGIEYLDMTRFSCINRSNIIQMLPDGVHPSIECHALLAREMAKKLNFS